MIRNALHVAWVRQLARSAWFALLHAIQEHIDSLFRLSKQRPRALSHLFEPGCSSTGVLFRTLRRRRGRRRQVEGSLGRQENQASEETAGRSVRLNPESMAMMHWLFQVGGEAANKVD